MSEPEQLKRGRSFHRKVQEAWREKHEGDARSELPVAKANGRRGRIDLCLDPGTETVTVVEIKASDWDRMTEAAVHRNVRRYAAQVLAYVDSQMLDPKTGVCPGVVLQRRPRLPGRAALVEKLFNDECLQVLWGDEDCWLPQEGRTEGD